MMFYCGQLAFFICVALSSVKAIRVIRSAATCVDSSGSCYNAAFCDESYTGYETSTLSGRTCQSWDSQSPHTHSYAATPDTYCRVFDPSDRGPWCYTTDPEKRWEYCFSDCALTKACIDSIGDCYNAGFCDETYSGTQTTTASGATCQRWDSQSPNSHNYAPNQDSFCRVFAPTDFGPWCFTTDPDLAWDYCFTDCADRCIDPSGDCYNAAFCDNTYSGYKTTTRSRRTCQRWDSQSPHSHTYTANPDNYCRIFDQSTSGPWCYTTDPDETWDYCYFAC